MIFTNGQHQLQVLTPLKFGVVKVELALVVVVLVVMPKATG
jgi:hypothetical protein